MSIRYVNNSSPNTRANTSVAREQFKYISAKQFLPLYQRLAKYYINLDSRPDRQELFKAQIGDDFKRVVAISYHDADFEQRVAQDFDLLHSYQQYQIHLAQAQIACTLSHMKVYQQVVNDGNISDQDWVLISEDDNCFITEFPARLEQILKFLQQERFEHVEQVILRYYRFKQFLDFIPELYSYNRKNKSISLSHPDKQGKIEAELFNIHLRASHPHSQVYSFDYQGLPLSPELNPNLVSQTQSFVVANKLAPYSSALYLIKKATLKRILANHPKAHWVTDDFKSLIPKQNILVASPCLAIDSESQTDIQKGNVIANVYNAKVYRSKEKWEMLVLKFLPCIISSNFSRYKTVRKLSKLCQILLGLTKS